MRNGEVEMKVQSPPGGHLSALKGGGACAPNDDEIQKCKDTKKHKCKKIQQNIKTKKHKRKKNTKIQKL